MKEQILVSHRASGLAVVFCQFKVKFLLSTSYQNEVFIIISNYPKRFWLNNPRILPPTKSLVHNSYLTPFNLSLSELIRGDSGMLLEYSMEEIYIGKTDSPGNFDAS